MNIFVGNIAFTASEDDLRELFEQHGAVDKVHLITDRYTGRSRGFGFVEMPNADEAKSAISGPQWRLAPQSSAHGQRSPPT